MKNQDVTSQADLALIDASLVERVMAASWFSTTQKNIKHKKLGQLAEKNGLQTGPFGSQLHANEYSEKWCACNNAQRARIWIS